MTAVRLRVVSTAIFDRRNEVRYEKQSYNSYSSIYDRIEANRLRQRRARLSPSVADSDKAAVQEKLNKQDSKTESTTEKSEDISAESEAVSEAASDAAPAETESDGKNILVAFFSRADENYNVGTIDVGNTQIVAEALAVGCAVLP